MRQLYGVKGKRWRSGPGGTDLQSVAVGQVGGKAIYFQVPQHSSPGERAEKRAMAYSSPRRLLPNDEPESELYDRGTAAETHPTSQNNRAFAPTIVKGDSLSRGHPK